MVYILTTNFLLPTIKTKRQTLICKTNLSYPKSKLKNKKSTEKTDKINSTVLLLFILNSFLFQFLFTILITIFNLYILD